VAKAVAKAVARSRVRHTRGGKALPSERECRWSSKWNASPIGCGSQGQIPAVFFFFYERWHAKAPSQRDHTLDTFSVGPATFGLVMALEGSWRRPRHCAFVAGSVGANGSPPTSPETEAEPAAWRWEPLPPTALGG